MSAPAIQRAPAVGELAPDFTLPSTTGQPLTLSSFRGRKHVLLAFFPLAFSGTCTAEMCAFTEDFDQFASRDVEVIPISVDSKYALKEWRAKLGMQSEMVSDFKREATMAYGVYLPEKHYANRAYFLIDKRGIIRWLHIEEHPGKRRENAEILAAIARATSGE